MKKLIWVIPVIMVFLSCKGQPNRQAAEENKFTVLIFRNSVIVYNGVFDKNTVCKKYLQTEPEKLKEAIEKHRRMYGSQSEILLKLAFEGEDDFSFHLPDHLQYKEDIATQNNGPDLKLVDITQAEEKFFSILPFKWSFIDSFRKPLALDLTMPKDEPEGVKIIQGKNVVSLILFNNDDWWCYTDTFVGNGTLLDIEQFKEFIAEKKKKLGDSLVVLIKPSATATYKATVDALDQMTINDIKQYSLIKPTLKEQRLILESFEPPEPVKIQTPQSVTSQTMPEDNAFLIEIRKDKTVWYQVISKVSKIPPQKITPPVTRNLQKIIADYITSAPDVPKNYLIKGDSQADYNSFEQVINALKENKIYKYNLVTSEN